MFLGREEELKILYKAKDELLKGKGGVYFISGIKGSGKTSLLNKFSQTIEDDIDVIYIDIKRLNLSPDLFSLYFIGNIFFSLAQEKGDKTHYFNQTFQERVIKELKEEKIISHANRFYEELSKQKLNYSLILRLAFQFPSVISQGLSIKLIILLDEFQEISSLSNYRIDPFELFKTSVDNSVLWILASSKKRFSFYFKNHIQLSPLLYQDIAPLVSHWKEEAKNRLFEITEAIPYPLFVLLNCVKEKEVVDLCLLDKIILDEIEDGMLYHYCEQMLETTISEARGEGLIRAALISLAKNPSSSLSAISKDIRRSPSVTRSLLSRLISTEIVGFNGKKYFITNKLLILWINIHYYGKTLESKNPIIKMLKSFNGQNVAAEIFAKEKEITLPRFSSITMRDDGLIDAEGKKTRWIIKVFEKGLASRNDVEELREAAKMANAIPWFISMEGFTSDVFFQKMDVMLSIGDDIKTLQEILTKCE